MVANEFGLQGTDTVRAPYATLFEAIAQAVHNIARGTQRPVKIVDEDGKEIWRPGMMK